MQTLRDIREKIAKLESEKASLLAEVKKLREKAETKTASLEEEVAQLREEAESLKEMLDISNQTGIRPQQSPNMQKKAQLNVPQTKP